MMTFVSKIQELLDKREEAKVGGGQKRVAAGILISFLL